MHHLRLLYLFLFLFVCLPAIAQQTRKANVRYTSRLFTTRDGLPKIQVTCLFQDKDGYLWIGTKGGLARFDGINFRTYTIVDGLQGGIGSITQLPDGRIFICSYQGYYFIDKGKLSQIYTDPRFRFYFSKAWRFGDRMYNLLTPANPTVSQGTQFRYITCFDLKTLKFSIADSLPSVATLKQLDQQTGIVYSEDSNRHYYWLFREGRVGKRQTKRLKVQQVSYSSYPGYDILSDYEGNVYKVYVLHDSLAFTKLTTLRQPVSSTTEYIFQGRRGDIFYTSDEGFLVRHNKGKEEKIVGANVVWQAFEDREGNFWLATEDGLYNFFGFQFREYAFNFTPEKADFIWSIAQTPDSLFWLNSFTAGLWSFNEATNIAEERFVTGRKGMNLKARLHFHPVLRNDTVFFPGGASYVLITNNTVIYREDLKHTNMFFYNDKLSGRILGGSEEIASIEYDSVRTITTASELQMSNMYVLSMCRDKYGRLWYTTSGNVGFVDALGKVTTFNTGQWSRVVTVLCDSRGNLWFAGNSGLWFYDYRSLRRIKHPLLKNHIGALHEYRGMQLILSSINGVGVLDLQAFYDNPSSAHLNVFTARNGFTGVDYSQNSIWEDLSGYVWINAMNTLLRFHPDSLQRKEKAPEVLISRVSASEDNIHWKEFEEEAPLSYPYNNLRFSFISPSLAHAGDIQYRYRLQGFIDWSLPSPESEVNLTNVPNGRYSFEVQSTLDGQNWGPVAKRSIEIKPVWYQTAVFIGIIALLGVGLITFVVWSVTRSRRKKLELAKAVTDLKLKNIRSKAIPHFSSNVCNNIDYLITNGRNDEASAYLADFSRLNNRLLLDAEKASRTLREEMEFVLLYLNLEKLRFGDKLHFRLSVDDNVDLDVQVPVMCIHTYVENAIKHGLMSMKGSGSLQIVISNDEGGALIEVTDDGIGREAAKHSNTFSTGAGLSILEQQISIYNEMNDRKIQQEVTDVLDETGAISGTACKLFIPYRYQYMK